MEEENDMKTPMRITLSATILAGAMAISGTAFAAPGDGDYYQGAERGPVMRHYGWQYPGRAQPDTGDYYRGTGRNTGGLDMNSTGSIRGGYYYAPRPRYYYDDRY